MLSANLRRAFFRQVQEERPRTLDNAQSAIVSEQADGLCLITLYSGIKGPALMVEYRLRKRHSRKAAELWDLLQERHPQGLREFDLSWSGNTVQTHYTDDMDWARQDPPPAVEYREHLEWSRRSLARRAAADWARQAAQTFKWDIAGPFADKRPTPSSPGTGLITHSAPPSDAPTTEPLSRALNQPRHPSPEGTRQEVVDARPVNAGGRPVIPPHPSATSALGKLAPATTIRPVPQPRASYSDTVRSLDGKSSGTRVSTVTRRQRSRVLRDLVIQRSGGRCENPACLFPAFAEVTASGAPILEVDHVQDLALGGEDQPTNMIALCPNCHAVKTRGTRSDDLRQQLLPVARTLHAQAMSNSKLAR